MADARRGVVCDNCKRTLQPTDRWIALGGKQVWCADCWSRRFSSGPAASAIPPAPPPPGAPAEMASPPPAAASPQPQAPDAFALKFALEPPISAPRTVPPTAPFGVPPGPMARPGIVVAPQRAATSATAIASLVCGLVGIFACVLGPILGAAGVILGAVALSTMSKNPGIRGRDMAMAGLLTGIVDIIGWSVVIASWLLWPGGS